MANLYVSQVRKIAQVTQLKKRLVYSAVSTFKSTLIKYTIKKLVSNTTSGKYFNFISNGLVKLKNLGSTNNSTTISNFSSNTVVSLFFSISNQAKSAVGSIFGQQSGSSAFIETNNLTSFTAPVNNTSSTSTVTSFDSTKLAETNNLTSFTAPVNNTSSTSTVTSFDSTKLAETNNLTSFTAPVNNTNLPNTKTGIDSTKITDTGNTTSFVVSSVVTTGYNIYGAVYYPYTEMLVTVEKDLFIVKFKTGEKVLTLNYVYTPTTKDNIYVVFNTVTKSVSLYINGTQVAINSYTGTINFSSTPVYTYSNGMDSDLLNATIGEVFLYTRALSQQEIDLLSAN